MADFWIKIEKGTPDKPEILEIAGILGIDDPDAVVGKMVRVWSWFDSNSENGHAPSVTKILLDRLTGVTGFTDAMVSVGWLEIIDDGYSVPNFDRHLGKCAKKRGLDAERKRKSRSSSQERHATSVTEKGLDKRESRERVDIVDTTSNSTKSDRMDYSAVQEIWNRCLTKASPITVMTDKRKRIVKRLFSQFEMDLVKWENYLKFINSSDRCAWMFEERDRGNGQKWQPKGFEYIATEDCYLKVKEQY